MRILWLILGMFSVVARAGDVETCRTTLRHVFGNLKLISPSALSELAQSPHGTNPMSFAETNMATVPLIYSKVFSRLLAGEESAAVSEAIRDEASKLANASASESVQRHGVNQETATIIKTRVLHDFGPVRTGPRLFTRAGQWFAAFGSHDNSLRLLNLDTFTSRDLPLHPQSPAMDTPEIFEKDGRYWAALTTEKLGLSLIDIDGSGASFGLPEHASYRTAETGPRLFHLAGKRWLVTDEKLQFKRPMLVPVDEPKHEPIIFTEVGTHQRSIVDSVASIYDVAGEALTVARGHGFYTLDPVTKVATPIHNRFHNRADFFPLNGGPGLVHHGDGEIHFGAARGSTLQKLDLQGQVCKGGVSLCGASATFFTTERSSPGEPSLLNVADLTTGTTRTVGVSSRNSLVAHPRQLSHSGREYFAWIENDRMVVFDPTDPSQTHGLKLGQSHWWTFTPFTTNSGVRAVVHGTAGAFLLQLLGTADAR